MKPELFERNVLELSERLVQLARYHEQEARVWGHPVNFEPMQDDETLAEFREREKEFTDRVNYNTGRARKNSLIASDLHQAVHVMSMKISPSD